MCIPKDTILTIKDYNLDAQILYATVPVTLSKYTKRQQYIPAEMIQLNSSFAQYMYIYICVCV